MDKTEAVKSIEEAVKSLDAQLKYMGYLLAGVDLKKEVLATYIRETEFDRWIEANRGWIVKLFGKHTLDDILKLHQLRVEENRKICDIIQVCNNSKSLFGKLFGGKKPKKGDFDRAKAYFDDLKRVNAKLERKMNILLVRVKSRAPEEFSGL